MAGKKIKTGDVQFPDKKAAGKSSITFGKILRKYRLQAALDQEQLGRACGVTGNAISNWERDVSRPDISMVPRLCKLLNMSLYAFFSMVDPDTYTSDEKGLYLIIGL